MHRKYGWKKDHIDQRDFLYRHVAKPRTEPFPDLVDMDATAPPRVDQGPLGSCTGNGSTSDMEAVYIKAGLPFVQLSRLFAYLNGRMIEGTVTEDSGCQIRDVLKGLATYGVCPESVWPYDVAKFAVKPTDEAYEAAKAHIITSYHRLLNLNDMLQCLADGYPFVFGITLFQSFESDEVAQTGIVPMPGRMESTVGGHCMFANGFDRNKQEFMVVNSWGSGWGDNGRCYIPFQMMERFASDAWMIIK